MNAFPAKCDGFGEGLRSLWEPPTAVVFWDVRVQAGHWNDQNQSIQLSKVRMGDANPCR